MTTTTKTAVISQPMKGVSPEQVARSRARAEQELAARGYVPHADIVLAGSTAGRPDWQARAIGLIAASAPDLTVANPRPRRVTPRRRRAILRRHRAIPSYRRQARARIAWEHDHLMRARLVLFWLTADHDVRPLDLLELGAALGRGQDIVIGADPDSPHRLDIVILTALERPRLTIQHHPRDPRGRRHPPRCRRTHEPGPQRVA